ncbi:MAG: hypothetical protein HC787_10480 [Nostocaceae cyanobacterium CSU_2_110]|nr:hypothetical protein [Nostocaceae cyanobacterium CSU_2_110]
MRQVIKAEKRDVKIDKIHLNNMKAQKREFKEELLLVKTTKKRIRPQSVAKNLIIC